MNGVHIRQSCPPPTSFIAPRTCRIRTKSRPSALCSNTRCMAPYCVSYSPTYTVLKFQPFKTCANSAFVKHNGWRINKDYSILNKDYSILFYSIYYFFLGGGEISSFSLFSSILSANPYIFTYLLIPAAVHSVSSFLG
jgi:hypothetical protein